MLLEEKSYEDLLIYDILYKTFMSKKPLRIRFNNVDGFIKIYDGTRYLVLFGPERYDPTYNWIKYVISEKSSITYIISHNFAKIKRDSYDSLPLEKTMTFHDVIILIKSVFKKDKNNYYYNIFLQKASYELPKKLLFV